MPGVEARIMTKGSELDQLQKFFNNMDMLTKTTFEVVNQFTSITDDLDSIGSYIDKQKARKQQVNQKANDMEEKLQSMLSALTDVGGATEVISD